MCMTNNVSVGEEIKKISTDYSIFLKKVEEKIGSYDGLNYIFDTIPAKSGMSKTDLFDVFLYSISEEYRQHYNCNTCRSFFRQYGWLATVNNDGSLNSIIWPDLPEENYFHDAAKKIREIVENAEIMSVFNGFIVLGKQKTPEFPDFTHFYGVLPEVKRYTGDFEINSYLISDFLRFSSVEKIEALEIAARILVNPKVHMREKYQVMLKHYTEWVDIFFKTKNRIRKNNLAFKFLAENPSLLHTRQSMIGTLLSDIKENLSEDLIISRFNEKTDPRVYAQKKAEATVGNLMETNRIIQEMNLESALYRRIAYADEVKALWRASEMKEQEEMKDPKLGIFNKINPEKRKEKKERIYEQRGDISILQLVEILDQVDQIFIKIPSYQLLGGITCPANEDAGHLIRHYPYGSEDNQFSPYFYEYSGSPAWNDFCTTKFYRVNTLCWNPKHWDVALPEKKGFERYDRSFGLFFLIDDLKDTHDKIMGAIFENTIRADIRSKIGRAVFQLTREMPLEGVDGDPKERQMAYGLCYDGTLCMDVPVRLHMKDGTYIYVVIDTFK